MCSSQGELVIKGLAHIPGRLAIVLLKGTAFSLNWDARQVADLWQLGRGGILSALHWSENSWSEAVSRDPEDSSLPA